MIWNGLLLLILGSSITACVSKSSDMRRHPISEYSYSDLIQRYVDLDQLALLPIEGERAIMATSRDPRSRYDSNSGHYVDWHANDDGGNILREENGEYILAEFEGPGCIWRIWTAQVGEGNVRIYLDDMDVPAIDRPFQDCFDARSAPFDFSSLSYTAARGKNLYFPIPDYYGYAWCDPGLFQKAYHAQTYSENNQGHQSVNRWLIPDSIPFQSSFDEYLEKYMPDTWPTRYAARVYWYLEPGGNDPHTKQPYSERQTYYDHPRPGRDFVVLNDYGGFVRPQDMSDFNNGGTWRDWDQLWWTDASIGDQLDLALPVPESGSYSIQLIPTEAPDYGVFDFSLDGEYLGRHDFYAPEVRLGQPVTLGKLRLEEGHSTFTATIVGSTPKASPLTCLVCTRVC